MTHYIGQRLSFQHARCTVRFVGRIQDKTGDWIGVEWDDVSKGKHNGSLNGIQYFICLADPPTGASFIRPTRPSDPAIGLLEAISAKYAPSPGDRHSKNEGIRISGKTVEEVGFDKIERQLAGLSQLRIVVLDNLAVRGIGHTPLSCQELDKLPSEVEEQLSWLRAAQVEQLDLSCNLLEVWAEVLLLTSSAPNLWSLKLQGNRFRDTRSPFPTPNEHLLELALDDTLLPSQTIFHLIKAFPRLRTLSASHNAITNIPGHLELSALRCLDLSYNKISSLAEISALCSLPSLSELSLRANPITSLEGSSVRFATLKKLDVAATLLPSLASIDPVSNIFPELQSLLTKDTPFSRQAAAHLLTIARVSSLTELDHSAIAPAERQNAELYYISQITAQIADADSPEVEQRIFLDHPRWNELCRIYGEVNVARKYEQRGLYIPGSQGARTAKFTFELISGSHDRLSELKKTKLIPLTTSTYRLLGIVSSLFDIPYLSVKLVLEMDDLDPILNDESPGGSDDEGFGMNINLTGETQRGSKWMKRREELVGSMRPIGDWLPIDFQGMDKEVRVRVEVRS